MFDFSAEGMRQRALLAGGIIAYILFFERLYVSWLYPEFGYFGFDYNAPETGYLGLAWTLSLLPTLWMPRAIARPSQLAYWVLYLTVLIPSMFVPLYAGLDPPREIGVLMLVLFAGFAIAGSSYFFPLASWRPAGISARTFWRGFFLLAAGLTCWVLGVFHGQLQLVSFANIYDLRDAASEVLEGHAINYAVMGLSSAINPFLMAYGLYCKRGWMFLAGALGQLLVYSVVGTKGSILSLGFVLGFYFLLRGRSNTFPLKFSWAAAGLLGGLYLSLFAAGGDLGVLHWLVLFVVFGRTFSMNGLLTAEYYDFFTRNPVTHYAGIKGVNWFLQSPYANPIGVEVGSYYSGDATLDASAHFWATDGLGAWGLPGVLLISVFCALVFWALDSAAKKHDARLVALMTCYAAYNIANISIFTSLLSGGLALLMACIYFLPARTGTGSGMRSATA